MRRLFVGGYAHGKVVDVPEDWTVYRVPVPQRHVFLNLDPDGRISYENLVVDRYELQDVFVSGVRLKAFVVEGLRPSLAIGSALLIAAGLVQ